MLTGNLLRHQVQQGLLWFVSQHQRKTPVQFMLNCLHADVLQMIRLRWTVTRSSYFMLEAHLAGWASLGLDE